MTSPGGARTVTTRDFSQDYAGLVVDTRLFDSPTHASTITTYQYEERTLYGDKEQPEAMLVPDNEREWRTWRPGYRTRDQERGIRFVPLYEIVDERYTVYFPMVTPGGE